MFRKFWIKITIRGNRYFCKLSNISISQNEVKIYKNQLRDIYMEVTKKTVSRITFMEGRAAKIKTLILQICNQKHSNL